MKCKDYKKMKNLSELQQYIEENKADTIWVAGATDIMVKARTRDWYEQSTMVDISELQELRYIRETDTTIEVGAMTTVAELLASDLIHNHNKILWQSCKVMGNPQIRNSATIGGNIANACLAADTMPALCVLEAKVKILGPKGERIIPVESIMKKCPACLNHEEMTVSGCYYGIPAGKKTILEPNELITAVVIPKMGEEYRVNFQKIGRKHAGCMSKFTLALCLLVENTKIQDIKLSIGAAFDTISMERELTRKLLNSDGNTELLQKVAKELGDAIEAQMKKENLAIAYKAEVCRRLTVRTIEEMMEEIREVGE